MRVTGICHAPFGREKNKNKKLSYCRDSSRQDNISDRGRTADHNCNPKIDVSSP